MDNSEFRKQGHALVDWLADYYENIEERPVLSRAAPGSIRAQLPTSPPADGQPMDAIMADFETAIMPGMTHWQHPSWFAYFPANTSPPSVLGELLTAGLGAQCMSWHTSPAATELEEVVMGWLGKMVGLPPDFVGVIQDTASTSTLCALITARERATAFQTSKRGLVDRLVVYTSDQAHSSVEKAARVAGIGTDNVRLISSDEKFAMIPDDLRTRVARDRAVGLIPACVVATIGTTSSTAIDPLNPIGEFCQAEKIWLHVDAAFAGTAAILPDRRWILDGIERADSLVFNPHKWMFTNFDCSAYFVRSPEDLIRTFSMEPEYLKANVVEGQVNNYRDWGIQLGRRFRALKLWFVIRTYGVEGLRRLVKEHIRLAELFTTWVKDHPNLELMAPVPLSVVCFRFRDNRPPKELDEANTRLLETINRTGAAYLTHTRLNDRMTIRLAVGSRLTTEKHVRGVWELIADTVENMEKH